MRTYEFTLLAEGADLQTDEAQDALFEAGCDDATIGISAGVQHLHFDREAASLADALVSAIEAVEGAVPGARVARVVKGGEMNNREELERLAEYYDTHDFSHLIEKGVRAPSPPPGEPMVEVSLRLPSAVLEEADSVAAARGMKVRALLREWIEAGLLEARQPDQGSAPVS